MKPEFENMMKQLFSEKKTRHPLSCKVEERIISVKFMVAAGTIKTRRLRILIPSGVLRPMPVVFSVHYTLDETDPLLPLYISKGWAVATPCFLSGNENSLLMGEDLWFHYACIDVLRKQNELDADRILVTGTSAGGYTTMMLSILHLGLCASVSYSGIVNFYFNEEYAEATFACNEKVISLLNEADRCDEKKVMDILPMPLHYLVYSGFDMFDDLADAEKKGISYQNEFSPISSPRSFSNPILFVHFTSDSLVPVDQLSRKYTYDKSGSTMPPDVPFRLSSYRLPDTMAAALDEVLPQEEVFISCMPAPEQEGESVKILCDNNCRFQIIVLDDGPIEACVGHNRNMKMGVVDATDFMSHCFAQSSTRTNLMTLEKFILMTEIYAGKSKIIPVYESEEDVYGTSQMTKKIILSELEDYFAIYPSELQILLKESKMKCFYLEEALTEIERYLKRNTASYRKN